MRSEPIILHTAYRHQAASDEDILHALRNHIRTVSTADDMVMYIGPAEDGQLIEVGVIVWHDDIAVAHCMRPARPKYLR